MLPAFLITVLFILFAFQSNSNVTVRDYINIDQIPDIDPDYTNTVIPPNIAPMNFRINETGVRFAVDIYAEGLENDRIQIKTRKNTVVIPIKKWKRLLSENRGKKLLIDIYSEHPKNKWKKYRTIENRMADDSIDSHVAYRLINPGYVLWWKMGIYQRNLENFKESAIFKNRVTENNCMNCHAFCNNDPETMMFHMRGKYGGTLLVQNNGIQKVNTKTDYTMSAGVYPAFHPDGNHIAFSVNKITQFFHAQEGKRIHVSDSASDLVIYNILNNTITTSPNVSTRSLENLPAWSPDGKTLYFCSGTEITKDKAYYEIMYDLMRIPYDVTTNTWEDVETVLSSKQTGKSISWPKISPDGKYLLFCMSDYGYFSIHFTSSDLYMLDLNTMQYRKLPVNSAHSDSYHTWSSNSRWFVFASKRRDSLCSRLYFCHVDEKGKVSKPFLMPQKDPDFYDTFIKNYNVPELISGPVTASHWQLMRTAHKTPLQAVFDPTVDVDALSGATKRNEPEISE
jgi:hypothetical protein